MPSIHVYNWKLFFKVHDYPVSIYMFKFNNRNTRTRCEIYSGVFVVNFEHISHFVLACFYYLLWAGKCWLGLSFWNPALKSLAEIGIPKKSLDTSLQHNKKSGNPSFLYHPHHPFSGLFLLSSKKFQPPPPPQVTQFLKAPNPLPSP